MRSAPGKVGQSKPPVLFHDRVSRHACKARVGALSWATLVHVENPECLHVTPWTDLAAQTLLLFLGGAMPVLYAATVAYHGSWITVNGSFSFKTLSPPAHDGCTALDSKESKTFKFAKVLRYESKQRTLSLPCHNAEILGLMRLLI